MRSFVCLLAILLAATPAAARPRGLVHNLPGARRAEAPAATVGPTLLYFGGPVIPNARVYAVWWSGAANISGAVAAAHGGIADFFTGVLDSAFMDSFSQYGTHLNAQSGSHSGSPGTNQYIGRGSFAGAYALAGAATGTVTDAAIQSTLESAIASGKLPPSDANTIYAIYFPPAVTVTVDGGSSCVDFGGYHDQSATGKAAYLVLPDCGFSFAEFCSVSSHELAEAVTDLIPTPGSHPDWPQAWNDSQGNESGDLCENVVAADGTIATATGTFTVQKIWDERSQSCKVTAHATQDFSVALSPRGLSLAAGESAQVAVQTATVAGNAEALTLTVVTPAGVTAMLVSSSANSGDAPALTVTNTGTAAVADGQIVVAAHGAGGIVHSAALLLQAAAGNVADAGSPSDAGGAPDGGTEADGGIASDGGTASDGGSGSDGGTTVATDGGNLGSNDVSVKSGGCGSAPSTGLVLPLLLALFLFGRARPGRRAARR